MSVVEIREAVPVSLHQQFKTQLNSSIRSISIVKFSYFTQEFSMGSTKQEEIREVLKSLAYTHSLVVEQMESMISVLTTLLEVDALSSTASSARRKGWPVANRDTLSVEWEGKSCFLGNTLLFLFFERIARTPNRYVSHQQLLDDVWGGNRQSTTIRGVVKRLRDKLVEVDMDDLAARIDGSENGYYGLMMV